MTVLSFRFFIFQVCWSWKKLLIQREGLQFNLSDLKDLSMADSGIHDDVLDIQEAFDDIKDLIQ